MLYAKLRFDADAIAKQENIPQAVANCLARINSIETLKMFNINPKSTQHFAMTQATLKANCEQAGFVCEKDMISRRFRLYRPQN